MFPEDYAPELLPDQLKAWHKAASAEAFATLEKAPVIYPRWDRVGDKYRYEATDGQKINLTRRAGIYVFYSVQTHRPVYVAECDHLKRELNREFRASGVSLFKNQWVRIWLDLPRNRPMNRDEAHTVVEFMHANLYVKCLAVHFGRVEIATDLLLTFKLRTGANAIDPYTEFEVQS